MRNLLMDDFVKIVVNDFTEIHNIILMHLVLPVLLDFESAVVELSEISDVEHTVFSDDGELRVVHFLFVGDSEVV